MGSVYFLLLCVSVSCCMLARTVIGQAVEEQRMRRATAALSEHFQELRRSELGVDEVQVRITKRGRWTCCR